MNVNATAIMGMGIEGLFYILLFFFSVHALFLSYHWFTYGNNKTASLTALALYLCGGAVLFIILSVALNLL